ncbi:MAG TPA: hypothetical protein VN690_04360 [Terriglobales bacterium]|nr:hypothetical protein [Terriglobales bacterium]
MLLSESELRAALEPLLDRILTERLHYFQLQLEPRLQAMIQASLRPAADADLLMHLRRLMGAATAGECFTAVYEAAGAVVGANRALFVVHRGEIAVWKQPGYELPQRFPALSRDLVLRHGNTAEILVRGRAVGLLHWRGPTLHPELQARQDLLVEMAGLTLLAQGLPRTQPAPAEPATLQAAMPVAPAIVDEGRAQRFARLLVEDLALYLRRERSEEFELAARSGDWQGRFQPEIERSRRAFAERFRLDDGFNLAIFDAAVPILMRNLTAGPPT